jgi:hypothetical protein
MPEKLVCRACGTEVEVPAAAAEAFTPRRDEPVRVTVENQRGPEVDLHRLFLIIGYLVALGGVAAFFLFGMTFDEKDGLFLWPLQTVKAVVTADGRADNVVLGSSMRLMEDKVVFGNLSLSALGVSLLLALVVGGGFVAVPRRSLALGTVIAVFALAGYCGYMHYRQQADWKNLTWLYDALCAAGLLAVLLGLLSSGRWIVLGWFVPGVIGVALAGYYLNQGVSASLREQWLPAIAGVFHGLVIGLIARVASWILNRDGASTLLGAFIGAFLGMLIVDRAGMREVLRTLRNLASPHFNAVQLPLISLYSEVAVAFLLALLTGFLGKRVHGARPQETYQRQRRLGYSD